jgi:hypothetical protein
MTNKYSEKYDKEGIEKFNTFLREVLRSRVA